MPQRNPEIEAGTLDGRVTLLRPVYLNEYQDEIESWEAVADVWAAVTPQFGMEQDEGRRTVATTTVAVVIRYRSDIDARWRIKDGAHTYEIEAVLDVERRGAQLSVMCKEVQ